MVSRRDRTRRTLELGSRVLSGAGALRPVAVALLAVGSAVAAKIAIGPAATVERPYLLLNGAVMAAAWYGGARGALAAIPLALGAAVSLFLPPAGFAVTGSGALWRLALFFGESLLLSGLCLSIREARGRAEESVARAAREVAERRAAEATARRMEAGLSALNRLGTALAAGLEPRETATLVAEGAASVTGAPLAAVSFSRGGERPGEPVRAGVGPAALVAEAEDTAVRLGAGIGPERLLRHGDVGGDPRLAPLATAAGHAVRSVILVRLDATSGAGVLLVAHPDAGAFDETHERLMSLLGLQAAAAIDAANGSADLRQALAESQAAVRMKDEFLSTLSHELRTPVNAIVGWAHLLQGRQLGPDETSRAVATIARNAALQENMIRELLDVSALLNGRMRLAAGPVDLRRLVEEAVETARPYAEARSLDLSVTTTAVPVSADPVRLRQVAWSLLSNAVKFTPAGGAVRVEVRSRDGTAELVVSDTGAGMEREFLSRVFSRFARADGSSTRVTRGLGLGLSLARALVELHGGDLLAESPGPGRGSTFTVRLPLLAATGPDAAGTGRAAAPAGDREVAAATPPGAA